MKPTSEPASHHCGHLEKSADEPRPTVEEAEDLMPYETETTLNINSSSCPYYVSISDRVWDPETVIYSEMRDSACEIDQKYEDAGTVFVGDLTKKQSVILQSEFHKFYKGQYLVGFWWDDEPYPPKELSARVRLNNYEFLSDEQKKILDLAVRLANSIRAEDGCESKNIKSKDSAKSSLQPMVKPKSETKQTRNRTSKYETLVQTFLEQLTEGVLRGEIEQEKVAELTAMDVAEILKDNFKAKITSVEQRVKKTEAWKKRKRTFAAIYDTKTFRNRKNTNTPYQKVQECDEDS